MEMDVAVCYEPHQLVVERQEVEAPGSGEVLVKVGYCGVCPSDLRVFLGESPSVRYPVRLGHEVAGIVEAVGDGVSHLRPGDRVVSDVIRRCGVCQACRSGFENHCENADYSRGGYAEYLAAPAGNVYSLRDSTPLLEAALTEPLACVVRGLDRIHASRGDVALVVGCGPMGLLHVQALRARHATVLVSDMIEERLEVASSLGATTVADSDKGSLAEMVHAATDGSGVDVVVIAASRIEAVHQALPLLRFGGRLLLFAGIYPTTGLTVDPNLIHYRELLITGSSDYTSEDFARALQLIEDGVVQVSPLISHVFPLADTVEALETVESRSGLKVVVRCNDLEASELEVAR